MAFARILLALLLLHAAAAGAVPFSSLFVFGDSGSDTGRRLLLQGVKPASPPYFNGRHSNGPMPPEYLQSALGLTGPGQFVNYAVGGAFSGHGNIDPAPVLAQTGLLDQLDTFHQDHASADPNALYYILGGDNDISLCRGSTGDQCTQSQLQDVVTNLESLVTGLAGLGAQHFVVIGPYGGGQNKDDFRTMLQASMAGLDTALPVDILYFDMRPLLLDMIANGPAYGFTHTSFLDPCYTGNLDGTAGSVCLDPDSYLVWDFQGHLTAPANEVLGRAIAAAVVPLPGTLALLALGLAGIVGLRRNDTRLRRDLTSASRPLRFQYAGTPSPPRSSP